MVEIDEMVRRNGEGGRKTYVLTDRHKVHIIYVGLRWLSYFVLFVCLICSYSSGK